MKESTDSSNQIDYLDDKEEAREQNDFYMPMDLWRSSFRNLRS